MKYSLSISKASGYEYSLDGTNLSINGTKITAPKTANGVYSEDDEKYALGLRSWQTIDGEKIMSMVKYVVDLDPYKTGECCKKGKMYTTRSDWDITKPMDASEIINGNNIREVEIEEN